MNNIEIKTVDHETLKRVILGFIPPVVPRKDEIIKSNMDILYRVKEIIYRSHDISNDYVIEVQVIKI